MVARVWGKTCLLGLLFVNCLAAGWAQIPTEAYDVNSTKVFSIDGEGNLWCSGAVTQGLASIDEPAATTDFCAAYDDAGQIVMLVEVYDNATATSLGNVKLVGELEFSDAPTLEAGDHWGQSDTGVYQAVLKSNGNLVLSGTAPLGQPSDVVLVVRTAKRIDVQWRDNASAETGYEIYVSTDAENYALVGTTSADATMFSLKGLVPNTWYDVRVCATDGQNDSPYSEVKTAATLTESFFCETWDEVTTPMLPANEFVAASSGFTWEADRWYWTWTTENEYATSCGLTASAPEYGCGLARSLASDQAGDYEMLTEMPCFHFADDRELTASFEVQCDQIGADLGRLFTLTLRSETDYSGGGSGVQISLDAQSTQAALKIESVAAGTQVSTTVSTSTLPVAGGTGRYWIQASFKRQDEAVAVQYQMYNANDIDSPFFIGDTTLTNLPGDGLERVSLNFEQRSVGVLDDIELASLGENEDRQASERVFEDDTPNIIDATEPDTIPEPEITSGEQSVTLQSSTTVASGYSALRLSGTASGDGLGYSVSSAGDVNGDGFDDILAGAPWSELFPSETTTWDSNAGAAWLIFGPVSATSDAILFRPNPSPSQRNLALGLSVSGAGDINQDGLADLLVGVPWESTADEIAAGRVYLVYGQSQFDGLLPPDIPSHGIVIEGQRNHDNAGTSLAGIGDFDGDGIADIAIGAPDATFRSYIKRKGGKVYLLSGRRLLESQTGLVRLSRMDEDDLGVEIICESDDDRLGASVAAAGDVNGDGYCDVLIGAPNKDRYVDGVFQSDVGCVYVIYGGPFERFSQSKLSLEDYPALESESTVYGTLLLGDQPGGKLGTSVAGVGDVNGDGADDWLAGAPYQNIEDGGSVINRAGMARLVLGTNVAATTDYVTLTANDRVGASVAGAGDVDGDGLFDFIIGAPGATHYQGAGPDEGNAYLVLGDNYASRVNLPTGATKLEGSVTGGSFGLSVATAGDVEAGGTASADGLSDLVVGAPGSTVVTPTISATLGSMDVISKDSATPAASRAFSIWNNTDQAVLRGVGQVGYGIPASRCWVAFDEGYGATQSSASQTHVTLVSGTSAQSGLATYFGPLKSSVYWQVQSNRHGQERMDFVFKFTDGEVTGLSKTDLKLMVAPALAGPWLPVYGGECDAQHNMMRGSLNDPEGLSDGLYFTVVPAAFVLNASQAPGGVQLVWDDSCIQGTVDHYEIYRSDDLDNALESNWSAANTSYVDATAQQGNEYEYYIVAVMSDSSRQISKIVAASPATTCEQRWPDNWD